MGMALEFRKTVKADYPDVITDAAVAALEALARFDAARQAVMAARIKRRADRAAKKQRIGFLDPHDVISRTFRGSSQLLWTVAKRLFGKEREREVTSSISGVTWALPWQFTV